MPPPPDEPGNADRPAAAKRPGGRSARVQAAVFAAAADLLREPGRSRVTLARIAGRAGVTSSTVYRRWGSLENLVDAMKASDLASARRSRGDAGANRDRLLAAAAAVMTRAGRHAPLADIAAEAGVGVGTLYRSYADRDALMQALELRAYTLLTEILGEIPGRELTGLDAIGEFLARTLEIAAHLVLPLHGAPPLVTAEAVAARQEINVRLEEFIAGGRADGTVTAAVNATDIIVFSALMTQPLAHGPDWEHMAARQLAIFLNGIAGGGPRSIPEPPVTRGDIERAFSRAGNSPQA
jgi:AcrR family transcriptional regulator